MSDNSYPLTVEEIEAWFRSKETTLGSLGVTLAGISTNRRSNKPSVAADFDTPEGIGRISIWVSGETDFEVLQRADGKNVFFRHEVISRLDSSALGAAFSDFLGCILHPEATVSQVA